MLNGFLILESSLETTTWEEDEENSQASGTQKETTDTSSDENFERNHCEFKEDDAIVSSGLSIEDSEELRERNKPKHSSEEVKYLHSELNQVVEDHMEKENLDKEGGWCHWKSSTHVWNKFQFDFVDADQTTFVFLKEQAMSDNG